MMLFSKYSFAVAGFIAALCEVATATDGVFQLYAYGNGVAGPLTYGDGTCYIGYAVPSNCTVKTNITFTSTTPSDKNSVQSGSFAVNPKDSTVTFNSTKNMMITTKAGSFESVRLLSNSSKPSGATASGFGFYGHSAMHWGPNGAEANWWATKTGTKGLWTLKWNADGSEQPDSVPVVIKDTAPITSAYTFTA